MRMVKKVGSSIAKVACQPPEGGGYVNHMQNLEWEYAVVKSKEVNAFVVPGGKVVVYTGTWGAGAASVAKFNSWRFAASLWCLGAAFRFT